VNLPGLEWLRNVNGDRAAALEQFVTGWYPAAGATEPPASCAPSRLPARLRQLHRLAKQRPGALGTQNRILPEPDMHTDHLGEMLVFGVESQGGFLWSLLWTLDGPEADPTVWFREFDEEPIAEQEPLSGFLIQFSLFEASMGADYLALPRRLTAAQVAQLTQALHPVPLRPFWPWAPTHFYVAPGLVVRVSNEGAKISMSGPAPPTEAPWNRWRTSPSTGPASTADVTRSATEPLNMLTCQLRREPSLTARLPDGEWHGSAR
jgi:hypothetical protein